MLSITELSSHVETLPEEAICDGAIRKYVVFNGDKVYLHPQDPRFGATLAGELYSFRRPMGARGNLTRKPGVNFAKPRILNGHVDSRGVVMITIETHKKTSKGNFINEIYRDKPHPRCRTKFANLNEKDFCPENLYWT